jgi:hypothetical protein
MSSTITALTSGGGLAMAGDTSGQLELKTNNGTTAVTIDTSQNIYFGTNVQGAAGTAIQVTAFNNSFYGLRLNTSNSGGASCIQFNNSAGTQQGLISNNGAGTTTYGTSSDYRLKDDVTPMTGALSTVAQLKPVSYKWKLSGEQATGFIAHELAEIFPEAIQGEKDAVHEDGSIKPQGIDTSFLVATLTAAIQEQQAIITDLKTRIETLEAK